MLSVRDLKDANATGWCQHDVSQEEPSGTRRARGAATEGPWDHTEKPPHIAWGYMGHMGRHTKQAGPKGPGGSMGPSRQTM